METMKGGTGVFIDLKNAETNFFEFIQNADIEYLSAGTFGITFKAVIPKSSTYVSKYKHIDSNYFGNPVTSLIIKLSILEYIPGLTKLLL